MNPIERLITIGDFFDSVGQYDLADKTDAIVKLAADVTFNIETQKRPFDKEEEQRLIVNEYQHWYRMFLLELPQIDYLKPYWDVLRNALDHTSLVLTQQIKDKTEKFDFERLKERLQEVIQTRNKLSKWREQEVEKARVVSERALVIEPLRNLRDRLSRLYKDDPALSSIEEEFQKLINVFENIFQKTAGEISNISFPRG